jgi:DNA mismatch endonuclease (patch repair protein)
MDHLTKEKRSWNMSQIRSKDTSIEKKVRSFFFKKGLRYRIHNKKLPGKPDIYFKKYNAVIFINGCFWHRHKNCKRCTNPKTNKKYWRDKFIKNTKRDKENYKKLRKLGFRVYVIWECQVSNEKRLEYLYYKIVDV